MLTMDEGNEGKDLIKVFLRNLTKRFGEVLAVDNVTLEVHASEFLTLLGPSGSGKTTTLMMIAGFETPTEGEILIEESDISTIPPFKRNIGVVFQNYALFPHMTVYENIAFPLKMRKLAKLEVKKKVERALEKVRLPGFEKRYPKQLSGGQQQRIALARALVFDPPLLLMDEPLGALDKKLREYMQIEIKHLQKDLKITTIYVTHDQAEALIMSDRIAVFNRGRIEQIGTSGEIYNSPANKFVADFIGETNFLDGSITRIEETGFLCKSAGGADFVIAKRNGMSIGEKVSVAIRPEKISFLAEGMEGFNLLQGKVEEMIYVGDIWRYRITLNETESLIVKQQAFSENQARKKGDNVVIGWAISAAQIL